MKRHIHIPVTPFNPFVHFITDQTKPRAIDMHSKGYLEDWMAAERTCNLIIATSRTPSEARRCLKKLLRRMRMFTRVNQVAPLRIVRKFSRKKSLGEPKYQYERFLIPVPAKARNIVRPWVGRDMEVHVEPFGEGFAVLVYPEERWIGLWRISSRFSFLVKQLEKDMGLRE